MAILDYFKKSARAESGQEVRTSALALAAMVFGIVLVPINCGALVLLVPHSFDPPPMWSEGLYYGDYLLFAFAPGVLGTLAIIRIKRRNSGLTGGYFACVGIFVSMLLLVPVGSKICQMLF